MAMTVVCVRVMAVAMAHDGMQMPMGMWLPRWIGRGMRMAMVQIMHVAVLVCQRRVLVRMIVPLGQVQP